MKNIRTVIWVAITIISMIIEYCIRILLFPIAVVFLIVLTLLGQRKTINSNAFKKLFDYASPWLFVEQFYLSAEVSKFLDPSLD